MYIIKKINKRILSPFDKIWDNAQVAEITTINWNSFPDRPYSTGRILYSDYGLHIRLQTDEQPLLARYTIQNSAVCSDSCMEFFISPNNADRRYMNFEFNPFGTMYLAVRESRNNFEYAQKSKEYFDVVSVVNDREWILQFAIPFDFIKDIFGGYTNVMKANMYKCREDDLYRHSASFCPIRSPEVDFHKPEYFGEFSLEK